MSILFKLMTISLSLFSGLEAMEVEDTVVEDSETSVSNYLPEVTVESGQGQMLQEHKRRLLTPTEEEIAYKFWLVKQAIDKGTLSWVPEDIQNLIGVMLYELFANPVLDSELIYTDEDKKTTFKIKTLIKNGSIDLSNKDVFGDASDYLLITTDLEKFFSIVENSERLFILIAPRFLIEEKIENTAKSFKMIMEKWNIKQAPIGIFYRMENWSHSYGYDYLVTLNTTMLSTNNLCENWQRRVTHQPERISGMFSRSALMNIQATHRSFHKFHVFFNS